MCGTFHFHFVDDDKTSKQLQNEANKLDLVFKTGDVYPKENLLVIIPKEDKITLVVKKWGITSTKSLLINARSESLDTTYTFAKIKNNRCAIPANWFYEWNGNRKYAIRKNNRSLMFLAGLYNDQNELVILTGEAEKEMSLIHHRTPIILDNKLMLAYLRNEIKPVVDNQNLIIYDTRC